jgi:hypothetical protein
LFDFLEILYDLMPPWAATAIAGTLSLIAGIVGAVWHSHEVAAVTACNSSAGQFVQFVNGAAQASCGASGLFKIVALLLMIAGFVLFAVFVVVFAVLAQKGKLTRPEEPARS